MSPDEEQLHELMRARDACLERRTAAERAGAMRVRLHALDSELASLVEKVQRHCTASGLPLPAGVPPMSAARANGFAVARTILDRYLGLLGSRRAVRDAALHAGDRATARALDFAIRADIETIRKHCERSGIPLPPEVLGPDEPRL